MKDKIFSVLQRVGRSFMLPIAMLPVAGLLLGLGSSFTNPTTIATYHMEAILGNGTAINSLLNIMNSVGSAIFSNLPLIFAVGVAIGMAKKEKEVAALAAMIAYFVMNITIEAMLNITGMVVDGAVAEGVLEGTVTNIVGINTLQMGVFGGIIVGLGVAALHNRFYKIELPSAISFFGGSRFVPIVSTFAYIGVGILSFYLWPFVQKGIFALGGLVTGSGYVGTLIFGLIKRALIPFGLHHVFYMPFWQTAVGGQMDVAGKLIQGGQNIFFAQLADSQNVAHFSSDATRYFSGEFIFMIFGLPGAALAMVRCAKTEKRKQAAGLLLSAALASMFTGITEPIEFSFLFVAPMLFVVQVVLAGSAYMIAHMLNIAVGLTFSGGILDLFFFGILQGNEKTSWMLIVPVGIVYFLLYYCTFTFLIKKFDLKTPGREDDDQETRLYRKADYLAKKNGDNADAAVAVADEKSDLIMKGLGGKANIADVDCCATRLRVNVKKSELVNDAMLKASGATGVVHKGTAVQVIYGPSVTVVKSNLEDYLETQPSTEYHSEEVVDEAQPTVIENNTDKKVKRTIIIGSPLNGEAKALSETPDEAFASAMMGNGTCMIPADSTLYAPCDGEISFVFDTKHAIGFETETGISMLFHMGIDTVKLDGKGFTVLVENGQKVKKGQPLLKMDLDYIRKNAPSIASPVLCTDLDDSMNIRLLKTGNVSAGEDLIAVDIIA
ncbi:PTS glucose transporter subunit IIA [Oribacterium sp. C9]|uniref:PTS transporter subunit IIABC n=1 Tax=Oribacterium sp. C9 TaxID=1943579 RepID=UPI00098EF42A|nr:PTS transporter subunit IIABC [Oribacterium sp. C9]OON85187.1 PTS glucose transporter subunit IIA [Oribacterium sp. C9]